ncbi:hypothetical protein BC834DRAFT_905572 [Gloeopeniophorella convolvens]|nr:hypothetical protein BC834DRAFT_905572 [Gloeopeniophorella convolvens]
MHSTPRQSQRHPRRRRYPPPPGMPMTLLGQGSLQHFRAARSWAPFPSFQQRDRRHPSLSTGVPSLSAPPAPSAAPVQLRHDHSLSLAAAPFTLSRQRFSFNNEAFNPFVPNATLSSGSIRDRDARSDFAVFTDQSLAPSVTPGRPDFLYGFGLDIPRGPRKEKRSGNRRMAGTGWRRLPWRRIACSQRHRTSRRSAWTTQSTWSSTWT